MTLSARYPSQRFGYLVCQSHDCHLWLQYRVQQGLARVYKYKSCCVQRVVHPMLQAVAACDLCQQDTMVALDSLAWQNICWLVSCSKAGTTLASCSKAFADTKHADLTYDYRSQKEITWKLLLEQWSKYMFASRLVTFWSSSLEKRRLRMLARRLEKRFSKWVTRQVAIPACFLDAWAGAQAMAFQPLLFRTMRRWRCISSAAFCAYCCGC